MSKNILDIKMQKNLNTYLYDALPMCIIQAKDNLYNWFLNHYTNFYLTYAKKDNLYNFYALRYPENTTYLTYCKTREVLSINPVESIIIYNKLSITEFVKENINQGNYLIVFLNEWSIPNKKSYHLYHWYHESLIYGYDDSKEIVYALSFNDNFNFSPFKIHYSSFEDGFNLICNDIPKSDISPYQKYLYVLHPSDKEYDFDISHFIHDLNNYLTGKCDKIDCFNFDLIDYPTDRENWYYKFGANTYQDFMSIIIQKIMDNAPLEYIYFHLMYEFKYNMHVRMNYINNRFLNNSEDKLIWEYQEIESAFDQLRLLVMKYNHLHENQQLTLELKQKYLHKIIYIIDTYTKRETDLLFRFYSLIKNIS